MAVAVLVPLNVERVLATYGRYGDVQHRVSLLLVDIPLVLLALAVVRWPPARDRLRAFGLVGTLTGLLVALTALSLLFHPSPRGAQVLVRLVVTAVVPALVVATLGSRWRRHAESALIAVLLAEAALGVAQVVRGEVVGLTFLGENGPLTAAGIQAPAKGTFVHPYMLAGLACLAIALLLPRHLERPSPTSMCLLAAAGVPLGLTYSRMAAVAVVLLALVLLAGPRRLAAATAVAALGVGIGVPALLTLDRWTDKVEKTTTISAGADEVFSSRVTFTQEAADLIRDEPLVGVGPGRYVLEIEERTDSPEGEAVNPVHNVPVLIAAESGVPAGLVAAALLVALGATAWRRGPGAMLMFVAYLPFLMLDHFPWDNYQGLVMTGLWAGFILGARPAADPVPLQ